VKLMRYVVDAKHHTLDVEILTTVIIAFEQRCLLQDDVHCLASHEDVDLVDEDIIGIYYRACALARRDADSRAPALLRAADIGTASIYTIFGGQGNTSTYFEELRQLYSTYMPFIAEFLTSSAELLSSLSRHKKCHGIFTQDLDILLWLRQPQTTPSSESLISSPFSFPLIGLLQLLNYMVTCKSVAETPYAFRRHPSGTSEHSQGIITVVVTAAADTRESFGSVSRSALINLFWIGVRSQQTYPRQLFLQQWSRIQWSTEKEFQRQC